MKKRMRELPIIGRLYTMMTNMYNIDKILLEQHKITDKILLEIREILNELKYALDVQYILNKDLFPVLGLESIQAKLISYLPDKNDEFVIYDKLPIEHITGYIDGRTVISAHYSWLISDYAAANNLSKIEAAGIDPAQLPNACQEKDTLIIANPAMSALVLASPDLLREIAQKLRRKLVLVVRTAPCPIRIAWEGFYAKEREKDGRLFRWAEGGRENWRIYLFNFKATTVAVNLRWFAESFCGIGELTANCSGETVKAELNGHIDFTLNVSLHPGDNELLLSFTGLSQSPGIRDKRDLAFRIINFSYSVDGIDITDAHFTYKDNTLLLSDDFILQTLHNNGFYDVTSVAYANHGISKRKLKKTRYMYPYSYRSVTPSNDDTIECDEIVCYDAYRLSETDAIYEK